MPENKARSYILPLALIIVGLALLLDQLGIWYLNWANVVRFWPLILVFIGLEILSRKTRWGGIISLVLAVAFVAVILVVAVPNGPREQGTAEERLNYPLKGIQEADVRLDAGVGRLEITPLADSGNLYEADIAYDKARTTFTHDVTANGNVARVELRARQSGWVPFGRDANESWLVRLSPDVPTRLNINTGVNRSEIDLTGLKLTRLDLNVGVGQTTVILSGEGSYRATVKGGVGALTVEIPKGMEARIQINRGVGSAHVDGRFSQDGNIYVSDGYDRATNKLDLDIDGGVGSVTVR